MKSLIKPSIPTLSLSKITFIISISILMSACQEERTVEMEDKPYFDLRGFIDEQAAYLTKVNPGVSKTTVLGDKNESTKATNVDWEKELEMFRQADINKPSYAESYEVARPDSATFEYKIKPGNELPVKYLRVTIDSATRKPFHIMATVSSENRIYHSERKLNLMCSEKSGKWTISSYSIRGYQKLVFMDQKPFSVSGKIGF